MVCSNKLSDCVKRIREMEAICAMRAGEERGPCFQTAFRALGIQPSAAGQAAAATARIERDWDIDVIALALAVGSARASVNNVP